ncbi:MAG TPA: DUF1326 domain-containing protein [Gemmatimonadales bacterium]|jgi:hypothetical protein
MTAPASTAPAWRLRGQVILACNCDYGCPCNFNGLPTTGKCEGNWNWHITEGTYGDVPLSGLTFSLAVNWPAAIHQGNGNGIIVVDERASPAQRQAIESLVAGRAGGPWKVIATTIAKVNGPVYAPYEVRFDGFNSRVKAGSVIALQMEPVKNAVTQAEVHPRAVLPEGFVFKDGMLGRSTSFRIEGPVSFDHTGKYAAAAEFEYQGP